MQPILYARAGVADGRENGSINEITKFKIAL